MEIGFDAQKRIVITMYKKMDEETLGLVLGPGSQASIKVEITLQGIAEWPERKFSFVEKMDSLGRPESKPHIEFHRIPRRKKIAEYGQRHQNNDHKTPYETRFVPAEFSPYQMPVTFSIEMCFNHMRPFIPF
jgi:hypothetical protein